MSISPSLDRSATGTAKPCVFFICVRDLVYLHREAASANTIAFVRMLEAAVIAEKTARDKRLADVRERARREADRQKEA